MADAASARPQKVLLDVRGLRVAYGKAEVVRDVSFDVPAGKCTTLLGRNGVGKTTLLRCLMGVLPIRSGEIRFEDRRVDNVSRK
ncbi:MAG TPA: ATP-binding cassette domain-containing protein, partial [Burkholderiaceae bacterium]|nr:ATP-binding cassette domain-containing protein [Burkholderiaceae bacterium]